MSRKIEINMTPEGYEKKKRFMSDPEIARFFGVLDRYQALEKREWNYSIAEKGGSKLNITDYARAIEKGYTDRDIAKALGISMKRMRKLKAGLGIGRELAPDLTKSQYLKEKEKGLLDREIQSKYKLSENTLQKRKRVWNILVPRKTDKKQRV